MRLVARKVEPAQIPENLKLYMGQLFVTPGKEYEAQAVVVFEGIVGVQIVGDPEELTHPLWYPAWLFDVSDASLPKDWICNFFRDEPSMVLGPEFIAKNIESYNEMVELHPDQVYRFWKRVKELQGA